MPSPIDVLGPVLSFLSLELAAIGYLVHRIVEDRRAPTVVVLTSIYGLAVVMTLAYALFVTLGVEQPWILAIGCISALVSVFCYGVALYVHGG